MSGTQRIITNIARFIWKSKTPNLLLLLTVGQSFLANAQKPLNPPIAQTAKDRIELISGADSLVGLNANDLNLRKIYGKEMVFRHKGAIMKCDLAIQDVVQNSLQAFGRVKILQGDTLTLTGDTLYYDGRTRFAKVYGKKVTLNDKKIKLSTTKLEYDMPRSLAYYPVHGEIIDDSSNLQSDRGYYNTQTKIFNYKEHVLIVNPKFTLKADSLTYDASSKIATFVAPTYIKSKEGDLLANSGTYNTATRESHFKGRSKVENADFTLVGDTLQFNNTTESGIARGNVEMISKKDLVILNGNVAIRNGSTGLSKVYGNALMRNISKKDTLYLRADTLISYEEPNPKSKKFQAKKLIADRHVSVFRHDFQARCDSLLYDMTDSVFHFYKKPIIWNSKNQLEADTIHVETKNNKVKKMLLRVKSFVIAQDTIMNFNQIKGRKVTALFDNNNAIENIIVEGNGESVYAALDEKNKIIGMNRVECSRMNLKFLENKVNKISFTGNPDARLVPPREITKEEQYLEGFSWKINEKPSRDEVVLGKKQAFKK